MFNLIDLTNLPLFIVSLGLIVAGVVILVVAAHRSISRPEVGEK